MPETLPRSDRMRVVTAEQLRSGLKKIRWMVAFHAQFIFLLYPDNVVKD